MYPLPRFWVRSFKNKFFAEQDIFFVKCQLDYLFYMKSKKYCIVKYLQVNFFLNANKINNVKYVKSTFCFIFYV